MMVGYSKLLIEEQNERLRQLTEIVLATAQVREAPNGLVAANGRWNGAESSEQSGGTGAMCA